MQTTITISDLRAAGCPEAAAAAIAGACNAPSSPASERWSRVSREFLTPELPHAVHCAVYDAVFAGWTDADGPRPAWTPTPAEVARTNITRACRRLGLPDYHALHRWSIEQRGEFWRDAIDTFGIRFRTPPARVLDDSDGPTAPRWLPGATLNIAESCFLAPPQARAIVFQRDNGPLESMSYADLDAASNRFANALRDFGAGPRTAVAIAMPMTIESVIAYLGIVKAGAVVVSVADSFAPEEIRTRLSIAAAEIVVTQDVVQRGGKTLPMYDKVVAAGARAAIVVPCRGELAVPLRDADRAWNTFLSANDRFEARPCAAGDASNILFSSGTTGVPKAIPWSHTTPLKCVMDAYYHHDIQPGDVVAWPTNLGWMMGPWLIYASLATRATMALCDAAPNTREYCRFVAEAGVTMLGLVPSIVKAWRVQSLTDGLDWSGLRAFSSTGEGSNADDYLWLMARARYRPVVEYCGGTEIGGGFITQSLTQPASPSSFSTPSLGLDVVILDDEGRPTRNGELYVVPPSIGLSLTLLNRDHHEAYYAGTPRGPRGEQLRRHGDVFEQMPGGYYRTHGRADDTMNLGGIKVSSAEIERAVVLVDGVADVAAIAVEPPGGGPSQLVLFVVGRPGAALEPEALRKSAQASIAKHLNPLFRVSEVRLTDALPRTASNKVMRRVLRDQCRA
jgi:acetyl-CoA synthetase